MDGYMVDENSIVELVDEDGKPVKFEHLMTLDFEGKQYVLLAPLDDIDGIGEDEVVILEIQDGATEEDDTYVGVEDEALLERIFERYLEIAEADEDELEQEEDEE